LHFVSCFAAKQTAKNEGKKITTYDLQRDTQALRELVDDLQP